MVVLSTLLFASAKLGLTRRVCYIFVLHGCSQTRIIALMPIVLNFDVVAELRGDISFYLPLRIPQFLPRQVFNDFLF